MYDKNVFYNPEAHGLRVVAELEFSNGCYQFDTRVVWEKDGALYTARDSGCSCPTPFEDFNSVESLERVDISFLEGEISNERTSSYEGNSNFSSEARYFIDAVRAAL